VSDGKRLGQMLTRQPELVKSRNQEMIRRFVDYVTADGFAASSVVTRLERLTFETIVTEKSYGEVLSEQPGSAA
jgi:hypothetical protein